MSTVRVVARIRPHQNNESSRDGIVTAISPNEAIAAPPTMVRIPSFKNKNEDYTFQFSAVYDQDSGQQTIFDKESERNPPA